ncbi:MAG: DNA translocase FtsK [Anaerolineaceae bacterium]|nr:DNA translocase FtsK [Anaerolineaceae bacterium]
MSRSTDPNRRKNKPIDNDSAVGGLKNVDLLDQAGNVWLHFRRYGSDILGVALLTSALLILLGLTNLTQGVFITPLATTLRRLLGWGSYPLVLLGVAAGGYLLARREFQLPALRLGKILWLEMWYFCVLALLAIAGGRSLVRAEKGMDGGLVGWGLSEMIEMIAPPPLSILVWVGLLGLCTYFGFNFLAPMVKQWAASLGLRISPVSERRPPALTFQKPDEPSVKLQSQRIENRRSTRAQTSAADRSVRQEVRNERRPPLNLLMPEQAQPSDEGSIHLTAALLEKTLAEFGIPSRVVGFRVGPSVTQYAVEPGYLEKTAPDGTQIRQKVRVSQISVLARDIALALSAERLRIESPVPGQSFIGIEVPNVHSSLVRLRPLLASEAFQRVSSPLAVALGKDVSGTPVIGDLARMPHLLVAGTTGSGKSVCIAALAICLAMNNTPAELRLALLDPKMVELVRFNGLPHLLGRVETKPERMLGVLRWALAEMDRRYRLMEGARARDFENYNRKLVRRRETPIPRVVIIIDELADLMLTAPDQTEHSLVRLAQMARATGIHLVVATQRPSSDVVTGLIKANFPARIAFTVASSIDSRVILDTNGAETLIGRGDMLFLDPEQGKPVRAQGVMVSDNEIERIVEFWRRESPTETQAAPWENLVQSDDTEGGDVLVNRAIEIVRTSQRASASLLQRRLRIGYPRAARLIDELEDLGVVGPAQGGGKEREVLWSPNDEDASDEEGETL